MRGYASAAAVVLAGAAATARADVQFAVSTWPVSAGGTGLTYATVVAESPWSWRDARDLANRCGGELLCVRSAEELAWVCSFASAAGGFACTGPWIGGERGASSSWRWVDGSNFEPFGWEPGRPANSPLLPSSLCLAGDGEPAGTWIDALPSPDAGVGVRSAVIRWSSFGDCDGDAIPDALEIAAEPSLDADGDGVIDACAQAAPADINLDGRVDGLDLAAMLATWGPVSPPLPRADINRDGVVSGTDLSQLLAAWTG